MLFVGGWDGVAISDVGASIRVKSDLLDASMRFGILGGGDACVCATECPALWGQIGQCCSRGGQMLCAPCIRGTHMQNSRSNLV